MDRSSWLLFVLSFVACGVAGASPLYVSTSGRFSASDIAGPLVTPSGQFALTFAIDSNPTPVAGSVTSLGFDVPFSAFSYSLNGAAVALAPSEVRFNTAANGGLFDLTFGSGLSASMFAFEGAQAFTGTVAAPVFSTGTYAISNWIYSDSRNYDSQSPAGAAALITPTPEPSTLLMACGSFLLLAGLVRRSRRMQ